MVEVVPLQDEARLRWYAAAALPRQERVAEINLVRQGFTAFCPKMIVTKRHAGRFRTELAPVFPGYLFVRMDPDRCRWRAIDGTRGVRALVKEGDRPLAMRDGVVESLQASTDIEGRLCFERDLAPGMGVRLLAGPFAEQLGVVQRLDAQGRVELLLTLFGQAVRVEARVEQLAKAG